MRKAIECSKLGKLFCGSSEEMSGERKIQTMGAWLVKIQRELCELLKLSGPLHICYFELRFWPAAAEESAVINRRPAPLK